MNTYEVTYEGNVYNYGHLVATFKETVLVKAKSCNVTDIQSAVEKKDGRAYGWFQVSRVIEVVDKYTPVFILNPREIKTSSGDRRVLKEALKLYAKKQKQRAARLETRLTKESAEDDAAHAEDLFNRLAD